MSPRVPVPQAEVAAFCERHRIRRLSLFGSVLRDDFGPESDVDVLVEFQPGTRVGYISLMRMQNELGGILGRRTDIVRPAGLRHWLREEVLGSAELQYESAQ